MSNKFDFGKVRERAVAKANQELEQGLEQMVEQGGGATQNRPTTGPSLNGGESMPAEAALATARPNGTLSTERTPAEGTVGTPAPAGNAAATATAAATAPAEPTKGVQTYIPMSQYRRLNDIKLTRRENIADLAAQAINLWLDVQEGKLVVTKVE